LHSVILAKNYYYFDMNRILISFFILFIYELGASELRSMSADYEVSYGIFGTIGTAHCELFVDKGTYKINVEVKSKGLAKLLGSNRQESYKSTGLIKDGVLIPQVFAKSRKWGDKEDNKKYLIDHNKTTVKILHTKIVDHKDDASVQKLPYYAKNDILTLFFNLDKITKDSNLSQWLRLSAIGARKSDGAIDIKEPNKEEKKEIRELLGSENRFLLVTLNKKIFSSKNGEFMIDIDKNGVCDKFVLKDVLLNGDLVGKLTHFKVEDQ